MASVRVTVEGISELENALKKLPGAARTALGEANRSLAETAASQQRRTVPRATGRLGSTIRTEQTGRMAWATQTGREGETDYLGIVEYGGTKKNQPARPFVRPAAAHAETRHEQIVIAALRKALAG